MKGPPIPIIGNDQIIKVSGILFEIKSLIYRQFNFFVFLNYRYILPRIEKSFEEIFAQKIDDKKNGQNIPQDHKGLDENAEKI